MARMVMSLFYVQQSSGHVPAELCGPPALWALDCKGVSMMASLDTWNVAFLVGSQIVYSSPISP